MGIRVLQEIFDVRNRYDLSYRVSRLFRRSFLIGADIVNESLEPGQPGEIISHSSRNVVVYYASDDLSLRSSKVSNRRNRVASTGPFGAGGYGKDFTKRVLRRLRRCEYSLRLALGLFLFSSTMKMVARDLYSNTSGKR